jgi:hypothetical protein
MNKPEYWIHAIGRPRPGTAKTWTPENLEVKVSESFAQGASSVFLIDLGQIFEIVNQRGEGKDELFYDDVHAITEVKLSRLQHWQKLVPTVGPSSLKAKGSGTKNVYLLRDCYYIVLFKWLTERGLKKDEASKIVSSISLEGLSEYLDINTSCRLWLVITR